MQGGMEGGIEVFSSSSAGDGVVGDSFKFFVDVYVSGTSISLFTFTSASLIASSFFQNLKFYCFIVDHTHSAHQHFLYMCWNAITK